MAKIKLLLFLGSVLIACIYAQPKPPEFQVNGCQVEKDGATIIINTNDKTECEGYDGCVFKEGNCVNNFVPLEGCRIEKNGEIIGHNPTNRRACIKEDECEWKNNKCENKEDVFKPPKKTARFLGIAPSSFCIPVPKPFPTGCKYARNEPYVTIPPVDVPYCVRIPCSLDRAEQKILDNSHFKCGSQPGCYFDVELFEYRKYPEFAGVLAGVPVCHLAIRRSVFHREAQKAIQQVGSWNPYFTNCLLKTFDEEIKEQPPGCKLLDILKVFNIPPKLAGWCGITEKECILIDACWTKEGCVYPVDVDNIVVKSNQRFIFNRFEVTYGRPKCQHFNKDNAYEFLKSYHRCLIAGCSIDADIAAMYYNKLFDIGLQMDVKDNWLYWIQVEAGKIGAYNVDEGVYWPYDRSFGKKPKPPVPPVPGTNANNPPNPFVPPFVPPGAAADAASQFPPPFPPPTIPDLPTFSSGQNPPCGFAYRQLGYRPCPPPQPPQHIPSPWCPYKPFVVPRFKPLKGSFRCCCDINPCYLSRRDIRKMHTGPSYYYTEWSLFGPCSKTCNTGVKKRFRKCVSHDESVCNQHTEESRPCETQRCGKWGYWSPYKPVCEYRFQLQTSKRICEPQGSVCGPNEETEQERNRYCP